MSNIWIDRFLNVYCGTGRTDCSAVGNRRLEEFGSPM